MTTDTRKNSREHGMRPGIPQRAHDIVSDTGGRTGFGHRRRWRYHGSDQNVCIPIDAAIKLGKRQYPGNKHEGRTNYRRDGRGNNVEGKQDDKQQQDVATAPKRLPAQKN
jgi:hypothetical protein